MSDVVDARWLMVLTAVLLAWSGGRIVLRARREAAVTVPDGAGPAGGEVVGEDPVAAGRPGVTRPALAAVGAASGFVAGLLGVGGGVIMMPVFTTVLRLPVKVAVASSLVAVAIFSIPALVTHAVLDHIDWPVSLLLTAGTVPGARVGSVVTIGQSDRRVELSLGVFFLVVAVVFGGGELLSILRHP